MSPQHCDLAKRLIGASLKKSLGQLTRHYSMEEIDDGFEIEQMKVDCEKWIYSAKLLLSDILKEPLIVTFPNMEKRPSQIEKSFDDDTKKPVLSEYLEKLLAPRKDEVKMQERGADTSDGAPPGKPPDTVPLPPSEAESFHEESSEKDSKHLDTGATKSPEATKKPARSKSRKTKTLETIKMSEITTTPVDTKTSDDTKTTEDTKTSEDTKTPEATQSPEVTKPTKTHEVTKTTKTHHETTKATKTHHEKTTKVLETTKAIRAIKSHEASRASKSPDGAKIPRILQKTVSSVSEGTETEPGGEAYITYVSVSTQTVSQLTYSEYRMEQLSKLKRLESKKSIQGHTQSLDSVSRLSADASKSSSYLTSKSQADEDTIEVIGSDGNTLSKTLEYSKHQIPDKLSLLELDLKVPDTNKAFIALSTVKMLQEQLIATEKRAQEYENRADIAEFELIQLQGKLQALMKTGKDLNTSAIPISDRITESSTSLPSTQTGKALKKSQAKTAKSKKK